MGYAINNHELQRIEWVELSIIEKRIYLACIGVLLALCVVLAYIVMVCPIDRGTLSSGVSMCLGVRG